MSDSNLLKPLEALNCLDAIEFLYFNKSYLSKIKQAGLVNLSVCRWIVIFCDDIAYLRCSSEIVNGLLNELFNSELQSSVLQHLQDISRRADLVGVPDQSLAPFLVSLSRLLSTILLKDERKGHFLKSAIEYLSSNYGLSSNINPSLGFRTEPIISLNKLLTKSVGLPKNIVSGAYSSVENYIETHYKLLAEDFLGTLREDFLKLTRSLTPDGKQFLTFVDAIYDGLRVGFDAVLVTFQILPSSLLTMGIDVLKNGNLIIIEEGSNVGNKNVFLATIVDFQSNILSLKMVNDEDLCNFLITNTSAPKTLHESAVYYQAYSSILESLQNVIAVPFEDILVECKLNPELAKPFYIMKDFCWDVSILFERQYTNKFKLLLSEEKLLTDLFQIENEQQVYGEQEMLCSDISSLHQKPDLLVNQSQLEAIALTIRNKVALIQGPPGTGKSFVGQMIVRLLLSNKDRLVPRAENRRPILVICYTNRALDSFLESSLAVTQKIIRVGHRSKSKLLEPHNISNLKKVLKTSKLRNESFSKLESGTEQKLFAKREDLNKLILSLRKKIEENDQSWKDSLMECLTRYKEIASMLSSVQQHESAMLARKADIVGLTTSGAAKNRSFIQLLDPKIVIIEEAGQVLESHVLSALTPSCQHLILIGDHQQLKPNISNYNLGQFNNLDVSLFERLIRNDISYARLNEQHRMRPEICRLVEKAFYPNLTNAKSVRLLPNVSGMSKNIFAVDHNYPEDNNITNRSKSNCIEADFLLRLAQHLVKVGNHPTTITILSAYIAQMNCISKMKTLNFPDLQDVIVTVVDNFQGEENDIILLSLVRSNKKGQIGFLSVANRVCVAMSRARKGFYLIGNLEKLTRSSQLWKKLLLLLEEDNLIGKSIEIMCPFHNSSKFELTTTLTPSPWSQFCQEICNRSIPNCGHICTKPCHYSDQNHEDVFRCMEKCQNSCPEGHLCAKACSQSCGPCEWRSERSIQLACGHSFHDFCPSTNNPRICHEKTTNLLPCGHKKETICSDKDQKCILICHFSMDCGHPCSLPCFQHETSERHNPKCSFFCKKKKLGCKNETHEKCNNLCYQICEPCVVQSELTLDCSHREILPCCTDVTTYSCTKKCGKRMACGHNCRYFCNECKDGCLPCKESTIKILNCGHEVRTTCEMIIGELVCYKPCLRSLEKCGHPCTKVCHEKCEDTVCLVKVPSASGNTTCTHLQMIACHTRFEKSFKLSIDSCVEICGQIISSCDHPCKSKCGDCLGGLVHQTCQSKCQKMLLCGHPCEMICGLACQPCTKKRCLFQPCHHMKCKAKCDEPCTPCKEKCGRVCSHSQPQGPCSNKCHLKCDRMICNLPCPANLSCGHPCPSFCGETCPDAQSCPRCHNLETDTNNRMLVLPCKHLMTEPQLSNLLRVPEVGLPLCFSCQSPIPFLIRFREEFSIRKKEVLKVFDIFFAQKSNLATTKKRILEILKDNSEMFTSSFKANAISKLNDKKIPIGYTDAIQFQIKTELILILLSTQETFFTQQLIDVIQRQGAVVGPDYVKAVLRSIDKVDHSKVFTFLISFHSGGWRKCDNNHTHSCIFQSDCQDCLCMD